ncbi:MAG: hypothetical protein GC157_02710 [Frankiales bacterium]|nr:hypothetical protein [Frankiales bacterium]
MRLARPTLTPRSRTATRAGDAGDMLRTLAAGSDASPGPPRPPAATGPGIGESARRPWGERYGRAMIRFLINLVIYFLAALIGIVVADAVLSGFSVDGWLSYIVVAAVFAVVQAILSPLIGKMVDKNASAFTGGVGIISTLIALVITAIFTTLNVDGLGTWVLAALIVWLAGALAAWLLPFILVKRAVQERRS